MVPSLMFPVRQYLARWPICSTPEPPEFYLAGGYILGEEELEALSDRLAPPEFLPIHCVVSRALEAFRYSRLHASIESDVDYKDNEDKIFYMIVTSSKALPHPSPIFVPLVDSDRDKIVKDQMGIDFESEFVTRVFMRDAFYASKSEDGDIYD
jgi:hypothetical protein